MCTELCSDLSGSWMCGLEWTMSTMSSEGDAGGQPSTTTISTVAVQAGTSQIVVAVLKVFELFYVTMQSFRLIICELYVCHWKCSIYIFHYFRCITVQLIRTFFGD